MDLRHGLLNVCPDIHGKVLEVLVAAEGPLSGRQIALRSGFSYRGVSRPLADLAALAGLDCIDLDQAAATPPAGQGDQPVRYRAMSGMGR